MANGITTRVDGGAPRVDLTKKLKRVINGMLQKTHRLKK